MDLADEFRRAVEAVRPAHFAWLKAQRVQREGYFAWSDLLGGYWGALTFGVLEIEVQTDGSWVPIPGGREAMIVSADDDLLAFFPGAPATAYRRLGLAPVYGADELFRAEFEGEPLYLWPTVLDWMRAAWSGCVLVDWRADLRLQFSGLCEIRVPDAALGRRLKAALTRPFPCPRITAPA